MRKRRILVPTVVAALVLAGCGGNSPQSQPGGPVNSSAQASPTGQPGSPSPTGQPSTSPVTPTTGPGRLPPTGATPTPTKGQPGGQQVLTGTITEGVEMNCLLLDGYLLVGGPRDVLRAGARVTVTGEVRSDLMTTCQQGTPFLVERAQPA
ncbi:MAG TPA: hypothetical protein VFX61_00105 [Micromonosporaceae bacterium]|nr:hypothetical protein [Micromonosporaceae bacterium]